MGGLTIKKINKSLNSGFGRRVRHLSEQIGSRVIILSTYNALDTPNAQRCKHCFNETFKASDDTAYEDGCPYCYGTTFEGGVRDIYLLNAIITDKNPDDTVYDRGIGLRDKRNLQVAPEVEYNFGSFILIPKNWTQDAKGFYKPKDVEIFISSARQAFTLRTGNGQNNFYDKTALAGYTSVIQRVTDNHPIHNFKIPSFISQKALKSASTFLYTPIDTYDLPEDKRKKKLKELLDFKKMKDNKERIEHEAFLEEPEYPFYYGPKPVDSGIPNEEGDGLAPPYEIISSEDGLR
jgi:hypothetical protein